MEEIKKYDNDVDKSVDADFAKEMNDFMSLYKSQYDKLPTQKKTQFQEGAREAKANEKREQKGFTKTVISPVVTPPTPPTQRRTRIAPVTPIPTTPTTPTTPPSTLQTKPPPPPRKKRPLPLPPQTKPPPPPPRKTAVVEEEKEMMQPKEAEVNETSQQDPAAEMDSKKIVELKVIAKNMKVKNYSTMNKAQLLISIKDGLKQPPFLLQSPKRRQSLKSRMIEAETRTPEVLVNTETIAGKKTPSRSHYINGGKPTLRRSTGKSISKSTPQKFQDMAREIAHFGV